MKAKRRKLSTQKKLIFSALFTLLFFGLLEIGLGLIGIVPSVATEDPYVGFAAHSPLFAKASNVEHQGQYETAPNKMRWFNLQRFPIEKGNKTFRIFALGGSTTYGHPYDDQSSFSGWLRELLPEVDSSQRFEVINCGGISYASYRVANLMEELLQYQPDLFIIYTGHNEFLEARTYGQLQQTPGLVLQLGSLASRTRIFTAMKRLATPVSKARPVTSGTEQQISTEVNTLLDSAVGPEVYHRDDQQRDHIYDHLAYNLQRMINLASARGAKVILVTPASNVGQCSPFKSENSPQLLGARLLEWKMAFEKAQEFYQSGNFAEAVYPINLAVELNSRHADTRYLRARIFAALGEWERAKEDFLAARDEDVCTLRAPQAIIEIVRRMANETQTPLVDFEQWVNANSPHGIPGDNLFLDHVHGTIEAYRQLAVQIVETMLQKQMLAQPPASLSPAGLTESQIASAEQRVMAGISSESHGQALRNISKVYSWAGKKEDADRVALRALELIPNDPETVYQAGNAFVRMGQVDKGIELYQRVMKLEPGYAASAHASLGFAYATQGNEQKCVEHYQKALELNPGFADIHYNLATIFEDRGQHAQAENHYRSALAANTHHYLAQLHLGQVLASQQKWNEARQAFSLAAQMNPNAAEPHMGLGQVSTAVGDTAEARQEYQWVLQRYPGHTQADAELNKLNN